jgi:hypothetical protein
LWEEVAFRKWPGFADAVANADTGQVESNTQEILNLRRAISTYV